MKLVSVSTISPVRLPWDRGFTVTKIEPPKDSPVELALNPENNDVEVRETDLDMTYVIARPNVAGYVPQPKIHKCPDCAQTFRDHRGLFGHRAQKHGYRSPRKKAASAQDQAGSA